MQHLDTARQMIGYIDAAPSPYHAVAETAACLDAAGFRELSELDAWETGPGRYYVKRAGSLIAWAVHDGAPAHNGFRVVAAHTDSPNLRVKAHPNTGAAGWRQLGVEVYGGVLLNSWLDRDLGLSGRVMVRGDNGTPDERLFLANRALLRVPQLAIHLNRDVNDEGLVLDKQKHMSPVWSLGAPDERGLEEFLAAELEVEMEDVLAWDLMCHDIQGSRLLGRGEEMIAAPRLDNLCSSYCGLTALIAHLEQSTTGRTPVLCLFDHEEIGSASRAGAGSPVLKDLLERVVLVAGGTREDVHRALADSFCISVDMAHATHPNYVDKHEPAHWIELNRGPVIKINTNQRYASDAEGEAFFQGACERADVPFQKYFHRSNLACGSTIGPLTAANLGIRTVDVGAPQLSMHSARELCGAVDPALLTASLTACYAG
jgi:aspartyl aminopeptidase